jgi:hypothetical protein
LSSRDIDDFLEDGSKVPMKVLVNKYSTVKIYDAEPPLPYMMDLIWSHVVLEDVRVNPKFTRLRRRHILPVVISVDEIVQTLREGFTFRSLVMNASEGSPAIPCPQWVKRAIEQLIKARDAEWEGPTKTSVRFFFQKYKDPLDHFIQSCVLGESIPSTPKEIQLQLRFFDES